MPTIGHLENILVENIVAHTDLGESVDALLSYLLSGLAHYSARSTDGVIFEHSTFFEGGAVARGVVIMIDDQRVEPVQVEFSLDETRTKLAAGLVYFGDTSQTITYGSKEDRKLRHAMIAERVAELSWKERFIATAADGTTELPNMPYMDSSRKSARNSTIIALIKIGCSRISGLL